MSLFLYDSARMDGKNPTINFKYTTLQVKGQNQLQCPLCIKKEPSMRCRNNKNRTFFLPFLSSGSLSLEAAVICPVIIGVFVLFCFLFLYLYQDACLKEGLVNTALEYAHTAENSHSIYSVKYQVMKQLPDAMQSKTIFMGESDLSADDDWLDLRVYYQVNFSGLDLQKKKYYMADRARIRIWTGKDMLQTEQKVFITLTGTVYHTSRDCTYLSPKVDKVDASVLETLRNKNGEKYQACQECCDEDSPKSGYVYVTQYGNCYHSSANCGYLNHCILEVNLSEVQDRKECSKCLKQ